MNNLNKLYESIENFKRLGVEIDKNTIESTLKVEENIIKKEMIPAMSAAIIPILSQIQRELVLVIEYSPDKSVELKMTKKRSLKLTEEEEAFVTSREEYKKEISYTIAPHKKSPKTNLCITLPNGKIFKNELAKDTLCEIIKYVGIEKVEKLGIHHSGFNLVSKVKSKKYRQDKIGKFYIFTQTSTNQKAKDLEMISKKLNLKLKIDILSSTY
ncbi:hypothetical protein, partial [Ornithobacterium rhinotracheale]